MAEITKLNIPENAKEIIIEKMRQTIFILEKMNQLLLKTGWFYDFHIGMEIVVEQLVKKNENEIDCIFIEFLDKNIKEIEKKCIDRFPERESIIKKAFRAHRKKDYETAIILFLTQTDGMFRDISKKSIFSGRKKYKAKKWLDELEKSGKNEMILAALSALRETKLLSLDFKEAQNHPNVISRNTILHGYELNFGNKKNLLKTISIINYIVVVIYNIVFKNKLIDDE
ncbi:MAG: hypothetical protein KAT68_07440 [Bacteroidales bacterium]|nr:hypothetical protein [Bacteroidales bacterium]